MMETIDIGFFTVFLLKNKWQMQKKDLNVIRE